MSFTPRNVSQLLVTKSEATVDASATVGDYAISEKANPAPGIGGGSYYTNESVGVFVKTTGGYKASERIFTKDLTSVTKSTLVAGVAKSVALTVPVTAAANTYSITIDVHDGIGSMLNDRFISAYVSVDAEGNFTKADGTQEVASAATVAAELGAVLTSTLKQDGSNFTVAVNTAVVTVTQVVQAQKVGKDDGIAYPVDITGKAQSNVIVGGTYLNVPFASTITEGKPDDLVQLKNIEWFNSGYDKDPYRQVAWLSAFDADSNVSAAGIALGDQTLIVQFYKDRDATNIERQHRQIIFAGPSAEIAKIEAALSTEVAPLA